MAESTTTYDRTVKIALTVESIHENGSPITVSGYTSTRDLRTLIDAASMWKKTNGAVDDLRRVMDTLVRAAQADSEVRPRDKEIT